MRTIIGLLVAFLLITPAQAFNAHVFRAYQGLVTCAAIAGYSDARRDKDPRTQKGEMLCYDEYVLYVSMVARHTDTARENARYVGIGISQASYDASYQLTRQIMKRGLQ